MNLGKTLKKIEKIEIQGAHNVAVAGVNILSSVSQKIEAKNKEDFMSKLLRISRSIALTRPTEPNLRNALSFVLFRARTGPEDVKKLKEMIKGVCGQFTKNLEKTIKEISVIGARRIDDDSVIFTHCHSNTVMGILKQAKVNGKKFSVICTETRPLFQGLITARELSKAKIPVTLIIDSASRSFMKDVDMVLLGADAIAVNGAVINKIGSSLIALAAKEHRKPVLIAAGSHKIDPITLKGYLEPIEERSPEEIVDPKKMKGVKIENPAFDVIPPEYIDLIITELGVISPNAVYELATKEFGWLVKQKSWWTE